MAAAVMAAVLAFGLTACGDSEAAASTAGERLRRQERYSRKGDQVGTDEKREVTIDIFMDSAGRIR